MIVSKPFNSLLEERSAMLKRSPFCRTIHLHIRNTYDQGRAKLRSERGSEKEE